MEDKKAVGHGKEMFYVFGVLAVLAATALSLIPSSMVYRLRLFDGVGLPADFAEVVRFIVLLATPLSVFVVGLIRVFAVSDENHEQWLGVCIGLEVASMIAEILAALVNGHELLALIAQGFFLSLAITFIFLAVSFAITKSGWFKLMISGNKQVLLFESEVENAFRQMLGSDESKRAIQGAVISRIQAAARAKTVSGSEPVKQYNTEISVAYCSVCGVDITDQKKYRQDGRVVCADCRKPKN